MRRLLIIVMAMAIATVLSGCKRNRPPVPSPQATAPTLPEPQPIPPLLPEPEPPRPEPGPPANVTVEPTPTPKPAPKKKIVKRVPPKPELAKPPIMAPKPDSNGQLSAGLSPNKTSEQRNNATQLLAATDANLRSVTRGLTGDEQAMVQQIRAFMAQSRTADNDGDTERAYNLALKAHLLSIELTKR